ncbi:hypothetical protein NSK_000323 [Nannochloropsis salina CCMP1776]|uniref:DUF423 domain-containing protein n=1 Tax=Nannochloropsis salina CCMP1776 TaxID=1027361 RepID=A0A4D9DG74_9STRA|nr:hypothetical protein NSK_000323 [Nannochloropsis salina CCMP1776]|eukprot:TFJ88755.1 hypothetical protein NSK_000323 [Nannochloropsis salina CCMP1776]
MVFQALGGISMATSVGLGAYGAHGLASRLKELEKAQIPPASTTASPQEVWSRANAYQQLHSLGLLLTPLLSEPHSKLRPLAGFSFASGIVLFSGGLYAATWTGNRQLSSGAPFGGVAFMIGWVALAVARRRPPSIPKPAL